MTGRTAEVRIPASWASKATGPYRGGTARQVAFTRAGRGRIVGQGGIASENGVPVADQEIA